MKKIAFGWIMAVVLLAGCSKEEECAAPASDGIRTLTAVLDDTGTRAAFGEEAGGKVAINWSEGDEIATCVDGVKYVYRLEGAGGTPTGTFVLVGEVAPTSVSEVYYPASALNSAGEVSLPASQQYASGSFDPAACVLKSEVVGGVASSFRGEYAVLCFRLTGTGVPVACVEVDAADGTSATLMCPDVPLGAEPTPFHIVFPAGEHTLTFKVITADGKTMAKTPAGAKTLTAGTLHRLPELAFAADAESWKVGDYFKRDGKEGIVFSVSEDGLHGKILGMKDLLNPRDPQISADRMQWCSQGGYVSNATDQYDGMVNWNTVQTFLTATELSLNDFPIFQACVNAGEGWYPPAVQEVLAFSGQDREKLALIQHSLVRHGGTTLHVGSKPLDMYWTSTEFYYPPGGSWCAYSVFIENGMARSTGTRSNYHYLRPVAVF